MGIGRGIAARFAEAGARVLIADLDEAAARATAGELSKDGANVLAIATDLTDNSACAAVVERCTAEFGGVDILVNNAGIFPFGTMLHAAPEQFDRVYALNVRGLAMTSKAAAADMVRRDEGGVIVNIASIDGFRPSMVGLPAYDASKGAVVMLTKSMALEFAPFGIRVNAIAPGPIATEGASRGREDMVRAGLITAEQLEEMGEAFMEHIPLGRVGLPDDIATCAVFLSSPASSFVTGTTVIVDGGFLLT
jgi:2-deoxy-D-gluconate 3-dehydrogenase